MEALDRCEVQSAGQTIIAPRVLSKAFQCQRSLGPRKASIDQARILSLARLSIGPMLFSLMPVARLISP